MKLWSIKGTLDYEVEAETEEDAFIELEENFISQNISAINEFWDCLEIKEIKKRS